MKSTKEYWVIATIDFPLQFESDALGGALTDKIEYAHLFTSETAALAERNKFQYPERYVIRLVKVAYEF